MTAVRTLTTDILILGSGGAGLFAALHAHQSDPGLDITIAVIKSIQHRCHVVLVIFAHHQKMTNPWLDQNVKKNFAYQLF